MNTRRALGVGASALIVPLTGCTAEPAPVARPLPGVIVPSDEAAWSPDAELGRPALMGTISDRDCRGDCAAGLDLSGQEYLLSCEPIPPSSLGTDVLGEGTLYNREVDIHKITMGARSGAVAVGPLADYCGPRQPPAKWYLYAYPV